ncbi:hypothetical protein GF377_03355 [candidate division GN15 bacterium]|nr:hypothetical protein [candidate division GN15 bacterium]
MTTCGRKHHTADKRTTPNSRTDDHDFVHRDGQSLLTWLVMVATMSRMEQEFICPLCGERTSLYFDFDDGDVQEVDTECIFCGSRSRVLASFNYPDRAYELEVVSDLDS